MVARSRIHAAGVRIANAITESGLGGKPKRGSISADSS
jgi:hypothetical protein